MNEQPTQNDSPLDAAQKHASAIAAHHGSGIIVIIAALGRLLQMTEIADIPTVFESVVANTFGPVDDGPWKSLRHTAHLPCGTAGCDCHIIKGQLFDAIESSRDRWRESMEPFKIKGGQQDG